MTGPFELELGDVPEGDPNSTAPDTTSDSPHVDGPVILCQHEGCGMPLEYSGKGRKPRFCDEHKPTRRTSGGEPSGSGRAPRRSRSFEARLEVLEGDLLAELTMFGKSISGLLPVTGVTALKRAERTASALVRVAAGNPRMLEVLEQVASVAPAVDLAETVLSLGVALLVDVGRVKPDGMLSHLTGVYETYDEMYGDETPDRAPEMKPADPGSPDAYEQVQMPPRFRPVGVGN